MEVVKAQGGVVVGGGCLANRSGHDNPFAPLPFAALLAVEMPTWPPEACPLCAAGLPITKPGSRTSA
jgi:orotate phosphoribosyltransferase